MNTAGLSDLSKCLAMPKDYHPKRLPSFPSIARTAVVSLESTGTITFDGVTQAALTRYPSAPLYLTTEFPDSPTALNGLHYQFYTGVGVDFSLEGTTNGHVLLSGGVQYAALPTGDPTAVVYATPFLATGTVTFEVLIPDTTSGSFATFTFDAALVAGPNNLTTVYGV